MIKNLPEKIDLALNGKPLAKRAEGCLNSRNSAYPSDILRECIAFLRALSLPVTGGGEISSDIARAVNSLSDYASDLDYTERPAIGEYDVTADIRLVCQALIDTIAPVQRRPRLSIYRVEGDEQFIQFAAHGVTITRVPASSQKGIALLKLDAELSAVSRPQSGGEA